MCVALIRDSCPSALYLQIPLPGQPHKEGGGGQQVGQQLTGRRREETGDWEADGGSGASVPRPLR